MAPPEPHCGFGVPPVPPPGAQSRGVSPRWQQCPGRMLQPLVCVPALGRSRHREGFSSWDRFVFWLVFPQLFLRIGDPRVNHPTPSS